jgi:hypothetical protein
LLDFFNRTSQRLVEGKLDPRPLTGSKAEGPALPPQTTANQLAAYTTVARVLLNLDEAFTKE